MDPYVRTTETASVMLGRLEGRFVALNERVDRYEGTMNARFATLEKKLDAVSDAISVGMGYARVFRWLGGVMLALGGYLANHLWRQNS